MAATTICRRATYVLTGMAQGVSAKVLLVLLQVPFAERRLLQVSGAREMDYLFLGAIRHASTNEGGLKLYRLIINSQ